MTYGNDTVTLRDRFARLAQDGKEAYEAFREYITSPHFSLDLRWQMFLDAPWNFSQSPHEHYSGLDFLEKPHENFPKVYVKWFINCVDPGDELILTEFVKDLEDGAINSRWKDWPIFQESDIIPRIKEQILKDNVKSFISN